MVDGVPVEYWSVTFEFLYRRSNWNMTVADVGYTYKDQDRQLRCYVKDARGKYVQSPEPLALNNDGSLKVQGQQTPGYVAPNLLEFEIYEEIDFSSAFGDPSDI